MVLQHITASKPCPLTSRLLCLPSTWALCQTLIPLSPTRPHFGFVPGSDLEQASRFTRWEARAQKDQLGLPGCVLDSVSKSFQKIARRSSWSKAWEAQFGLKKPARGAGHWLGCQAPDLQIAPLSQILVPDVDKLQLTQVSQHFWESHRWQHKSCHRTFEMWSDFGKKSWYVSSLSTQSRQGHTAQPSTQQKCFQQATRWF